MNASNFIHIEVVDTYETCEAVEHVIIVPKTYKMRFDNPSTLPK
jgi:hypothetical protein